MSRALVVAPFASSSPLFRAQRFRDALSGAGKEAWLASSGDGSQKLSPYLRPVAGRLYCAALNLIYDNVLLFGLCLCRRFEIVQFCLVNPLYFLPVVFVSKSTGAKIIYDMQDPAPEHWIVWRKYSSHAAIVRLVKLAEMIGCAFSDRVIVISGAMRSLISRSTPEEKIIVIYNTITDEELDIDAPPEVIGQTLNYSFVAIYNGPLYGTLRGIDLLIYAVALLKDVVIKVILVGEDREGLCDLAGRVGVESKVLFLGVKSRTETQWLLSHSDLLIMPYPLNDITRVAAPTKIFESMAFGVPVLAPNVPGFREVLDEAAFYYDCHPQRDLTVNELAKALRYVVSSRSELGVKSKLCRIVFDSRFRWATMREKYLSIIDSLGAR